MDKLSFRYGNWVNELGEWTMFGEKGYELRKPWNASIIALKNTEVVCIWQSDFHKVIKDALW